MNSLGRVKWKQELQDVQKNHVNHREGKKSEMISIKIYKWWFLGSQEGLFESNRYHIMQEAQYKHLIF